MSKRPLAVSAVLAVLQILENRNNRNNCTHAFGYYARQYLIQQPQRTAKQIVRAIKRDKNLFQQHSAAINSLPR